MTVLTPMRQEVFSSFLELSVSTYAEDNVTAGRWSADGALDRARSEFDRLLPLGLQTPDHYLFEIREVESGEAIGFVWLAVAGEAAARSGYLYNIQIKPQYRGRGHAKAALELIDDIALAKDVGSIALHVFSFNGAAQALYRSHGYWVTGVNMRKSIRRNDA